MTEIERLYSQYRAAQLSNKPEEARKLLEQITELRKAPGEHINYCLRGRFTQRTNATEADELRKKAAVFRLLMRSAAAAERLGDKTKAERMRGKAAEYAREMSMVRRSSHRTIDTPTGAALRIRSERTGK